MFCVIHVAIVNYLIIVRFTIVYVSMSIIIEIPVQASGEVQISMEAEVSHHLLAKRIVELHTRDEMRRVLRRKNEMSSVRKAVSGVTPITAPFFKMAS